MKIFRAFLVAIVSVFLATSVLAEDRGTKDEAKALVNAALAHIKQVGNTTAFNDFSTDKTTWAKKDLYVVVIDNKGVVLTHGANEKFVGKNLFDFKDQNGKLFVQELIATGSKGEGWVDYDFSNPVTKKVEPKSSFTKKIPGFDGIVFVGAYR